MQKLEGMAATFGQVISERLKVSYSKFIIVHLRLQPKSIVITEVAPPTISDPDFLVAASAWLVTHSVSFVRSMFIFAVPRRLGGMDGTTPCNGWTAVDTRSDY